MRRTATLAFCALLAASALGCGGDDGGGDKTLAEEDVQACFEDAGLTIDTEGTTDIEGMTVDFTAVFDTDQRVDVWVEESRGDAEKTADLLRGVAEAFDLQDFDDYLVLDNNVGAAFQEKPSDEDRQVVEDCLSG